MDFFVRICYLHRIALMIFIWHRGYHVSSQGKSYKVALSQWRQSMAIKIVSSAAFSVSPLDSPEPYRQKLTAAVKKR